VTLEASLTIGRTVIGALEISSVFCNGMGQYGVPAPFSSYEK